MKDILFEEYKYNDCYQAIKEYYGDQRAARSQVPYIQHIDEGLAIMRMEGYSRVAMDAYCLHPIFQADGALRETLDPVPHKIWTSYKIGGMQIVLAMEYRRVANSYLSHDAPSDRVETPLREVYWMLVADKVQNRKDFELHHKGKHPRSDELDFYFREWMKILNISESRYEQLVKGLANYV